MLRITNITRIFLSLVLLLFAGNSAADIRINAGGKVTNVKIPQINVALDSSGMAAFASEDVQYLSKSGEPRIPWKAMTVLLPPNADLKTVSSNIESVEYSVIDGLWDVSPVPPVLTRNKDNNEIEIWPKGKTIVDGHDADIYSTDALWPHEDVQLTGTGRLHEWKLVEIAMPLVLYNPKSGELQRLVSAEITVDYERKANAGKGKAKGKAKAGASANASKGNSGKWRKLGRIKKLAVNSDDAISLYEAAEGGEVSALAASPSTGDDTMPLSSDGSSGYVIITTNDIRANSTKLADFVLHKENMGFTVTVIDEDDTGATATGDAAATKLREWLQANYGSMDLKYALIIGDPQPNNGYVPMKMFPCNGRNIPTDYFYAELTRDWDSNNNGIIGESGEIERYFEIYVGRIPHYGVMADTDAILQKTIDYETAVDTSWRRNTLISVVPLDTNMHLYNWGEDIKTDILEPNSMPSDRAYRNGYGHMVTDYDLSPPPEFPASAYPATVWSQGQYGLHIWSTHGWSQGASGIVGSVDTPSLNDIYPSTTFQGSCETAYPYHNNNLTYMILKNGGIFANGATRNSYYMSETEFTDSPTDAGMGYRYAKGIAEHKSCGEALWDLKEEISSFWTHNWTVFSPYGDPSVVVMPELPRISQSVMALHSVDSEETSGEDGAATNSFDGDNGSMWHTEWSASNPLHPHQVTIDLGSTYYVQGFAYLPRQSGENGRIADYEFYVSTDGSNWGSAVATGKFSNSSDEQDVFFAEVSARYVRLVALSEVNGKPWTSVAELNVYGVIAEDTTPPTPDPMSFATAPNATGTTSIAMVATTASDPDGVEYYFTCNTGGCNDSGWQSSTSYEDTGLSPGTQYTYTVRARDLSTNQNETAASAAASATTDPLVELTFTVNAGDDFAELISVTHDYGSQVVYLAESSEVGPTTEVAWSGSGFSVLHVKVQDDNGNEYPVNLRGSRHIDADASGFNLAMNSGGNFGGHTDSRFVLQYLREDNLHLPQGHYQNSDSEKLVIQIKKLAGDVVGKLQYNLDIAVEAVEISCSGSLSQADWSLYSVDSEETVYENGAAVNAFDGNPNTIWHSKWGGGSDPLPHEIRINLGSVQLIGGIRYLPRQDGSSNGNISEYEVLVSADPINSGWTRMKQGTFADDSSEKTVSFEPFDPIDAQYVVLKALGEAGDSGPWSSAAEINVIPCQ